MNKYAVNVHICADFSMYMNHEIEMEIEAENIEEAETEAKVQAEEEIWEKIERDFGNGNAEKKITIKRTQLVDETYFTCDHQYDRTLSEQYRKCFKCGHLEERKTA